MRKIKPRKSEEMGMLEKSSSKEKRLIYPTFRIDLEHLPEAKKWELGEKYNIELELKMTGLSISRFQNDAEFEIHGIEPDSDGGDNENEDDKEDDEVKMNKDDFINEHEKLVEILRNGSKEERDEEADEQEKELKKYK